MVVFFVPSFVAAFVITTPPQRTQTTRLFFTDNDDHVGVTTRPMPSWQRILDVNKDGKVDHKDVTFLFSKIFDVNGDGKVDEKDAQTAFVMTLLSWTLMFIPAHAKGGGGGGGGHSGHTYEAYRRKWKNRAEFHHPFSPSACSNMPHEGEVIDVLVNKFKGTYLPGVTQHVDENSCKFQVTTNDDRKIRLTTNHHWQNWSGFGILGVFYLDFEEQKSKEVNTKFDSEFWASRDNNVNDVPQSGLYHGVTIESDGVRQRVETTLKFSESGAITGYGSDSADGSYTVEGAWTDDKIRWRERYRNFSVTVRGERNFR
mmetsp:Transcript_25459/g.38616  ORF Transcript_25459/g.38616 Transcript_25459/m.38616 type:complete len:314 (-) Transcript_25459:425-1366(-)